LACRWIDEFNNFKEETKEKKKEISPFLSFFFSPMQKKEEIPSLKEKERENRKRKILYFKL